MRERIQSRAAIGAIALALFADAAAAGAQPKTEDQFAFDQPAEALSQALRDVAVRTGRNVIARDELVQAREAPPLSGTFTAEQAVARLLEGTGLRYRLVDGTLVIERIPGERSVAGNPVESSEAIVVTGTHVRAALPTSPVITISRRDIEESAPSSVEQLMRHLPQNLSAGVAQENFDVTGAGADITDHGAGINLRGLGQRATLVLVNGRRLAPSGTGSFVDISLLPISAIERVEVLTDGASAIYGSDAVGGVVNFILREDFRGIDSIVQGGTTTRGGGDQLLAGLSAGTGWTGGHAMLAYEYRMEDAIPAGDRDFTINLPPDWSLTPKERRHSLYGMFRQDLTDRLSFDFDGLFASRDTQRSYFMGGPALPVDAHALARLFGGTAALQMQLGSSWRAEAAATYFNSRDRERQFQSGGVGLVNIFNTLNIMREFGLKADGDLFQLPAGGVKLAVGGQARNEHFSSFFKTQFNLAPQSGSRNVQSAYGELHVPLFSERNRRPGLERLSLSAAARYDHYERLGASFDPKVGILWSPVSGLALRSSYGTSFRAPLLSESLGLYNAFYFPASLLFVDPSQAPPGVGLTLIGSNPAVGPERSRSLSAGTEWTPPALTGLKLSATVYAIRFSNRIALPTEQVVVVGDPALEPIVTRGPSVGLVTDLIAGAGQLLDFSGPGFTNGGATPSDVVVIVDARTANTAETRTSGLDLGLEYAFELGASRFRLGLNANRVFRFDDRLTSSSPAIRTVNTPFHPVDWRARASLSWSRGPLSAALFVNYTDSYRDNRTPTVRGVRSFTTVDAGVAWTASQAQGPLRGLRLALNVENLFDSDPPHLQPEPGFTKDIGYDPVNATGRGRTISVQLRKAFGK